MKVLVTGGAGYIGSVIVDQLILCGHEVVVIDNFVTGHAEAVHENASCITGDLLDASFVEDAIERIHPEAVIHLTAKSIVSESATSPLKYLRENVQIALNVLDAMVSRGISRFILSSTANIYGAPSEVPIDESAQVDPGSPYGESKFHVERMLHWLDRTTGLRFASLRYCNAAGATASQDEDHNPETHLIPQILQVASGQREYITVFGTDYATPDGTCIRDHIYVEDLAHAHVLALDAIEHKSHILNLGIGHLAGQRRRLPLPPSAEIGHCVGVTPHEPRTSGGGNATTAWQLTRVDLVPRTVHTTSFSFRFGVEFATADAAAMI